jgi:hypothetical protein
MRTLLLVVLLSACGGTKVPVTPTTGGADTPAEAGKTYKWSFDADTAGPLPADFISVLGDWQVAADASAPSGPNVLRQLQKLDDPNFPRVVLKDLVFQDLTVRVRCKPESGDTDQACGLMFRFQDHDNYYITRANPLEENVRLYHVVNGDRQEMASVDLKVAAGQWHTLEVTARGDQLTVSWNGQQVISARDGRFPRGKVGLWTKADSITAFDDFEAVAE